MTPRPMAEANRVTRILQLFEPESAKRFPIDVKQLALDYSRQLFPDEPITDIRSLAAQGFEGMLVRHPSGKKWLIAYNDGVRSKGRIRFTLAHELGHYLLHRAARDKFECTLKDMYDWDSVASRRNVIEVPPGSLLNSSSQTPGGYRATQQANLWFPNESHQTPLIELVHVSEGDYPYTLGLLLLPDADPHWDRSDDEEVGSLDGKLGFGST